MISLRGAAQGGSKQGTKEMETGTKAKLRLKLKLLLPIKL